MSEVNTNVALAAHRTSTNSSTNSDSEGSWFEAMAGAWGSALDQQANVIAEKGQAIADGNDSPEQITELTAESLRMGFLSNSSHTSLTSVGSALETLARKQ